MGKTTLYSVNIDEVCAAVGSKDDSLLNRMCEFVASFLEEEEPEPTELIADISINLRQDGKIYLKGLELTEREICDHLLKVKSGTVEFVIEPPWTERHDAIIRATNEVLPRSGIDQVLTRFESDDPSVDTSPNVTWTRDEGAEDQGPALQFGVSPEALSNLIHGNLSDTNSEQGQAFEVLCYVLGMKLPDEDQLGDLSRLQIETQLVNPRTPVPLPHLDEKFVISYLNSQEVLSEALRVTKMDLSFPDDEEIESSRKIFMNCLKQAAIEGLGIIGFHQ